MIRSKQSSPSLNLVVLFILIGIFAGTLAPTIALAAPPVQGTTPIEPTDLSAAVVSLVGILIAFAVGGGVAYVLQMFDVWKNWNSPFKPIVVLLITAIVGGALTSLQVLATPGALASLPDFARAFLGFIIVFVGSQFTYQKGFGNWNLPK